MKRCRANGDTQFLVCDVTILRSTLMPGLMCNDLLHRASIRVRPANVRMQFKILARTTNCSPQEKLFPTFNSTDNPTNAMSYTTCAVSVTSL